MNSHSIPLPSGKIFDYLNPKPEMIDIDDIAFALSKICRFNGYCDWFYSVAQHSYVGSYCIDRQFAFEFLLHDAAEAYCNDIVSPLKRLLGDYNTIETMVDVAIREHFGLPLVISPEVKAIDNSMYWTERYAMCPYYEGAWKSVDAEHKGGEAIPGVRIIETDWRQARQRFTSRFWDLAPATYRQAA